MNPRDDVAPVLVSVQESARLAARRRLLRGSLGVPAVLTLSSGAALASASSPIRCFNNAPASASDFDRTQFQVPQYAVTSGITLLYYVVNADDLRQIASASGGMIEVPVSFVAGALINVNTFGVVTLGSGETVASSASGAVAPRFTLKTGSTDAAPVFVVSGLIPIGSIGSSSGEGRIITQSCWTSFK